MICSHNSVLDMNIFNAVWKGDLENCIHKENYAINIKMCNNDRNMDSIITKNLVQC